MTSEIKNKYEQLKQKVQDRKKSFHKFINFLEKETAWLTSPASTRFHLCEEGGLLTHSVNVTENLLKLREALAPGISEESCVIVGLLHDTGKVGVPGKALYLPSQTEGKKSNRYTVNPDLVTMGHAVRSLHLVSRFIPLSDSEAQAIACHDGQYSSDNGSVCGNEEPLTLLVHWADYWAAHVCEEGRHIGS